MLLWLVYYSRGISQYYEEDVRTLKDKFKHNNQKTGGGFYINGGVYPL